MNSDITPIGMWLSPVFLLSIPAYSILQIVALIFFKGTRRRSAWRLLFTIIGILLAIVLGSLVFESDRFLGATYFIFPLATFYLVYVFVRRS